MNYQKTSRALTESLLNAGLGIPSCYMEAADLTRRSIERGEPQPTYMSQRQKEGLQMLIDWTIKFDALAPSAQMPPNVKLRSAALLRRPA